VKIAYHVGNSGHISFIVRTDQKTFYRKLSHITAPLQIIYTAHEKDICPSKLVLYRIFLSENRGLYIVANYICKINTRQIIDKKIHFQIRRHIRLKTKLIPMRFQNQLGL